MFLAPVGNDLPADRRGGRVARYVDFTDHGGSGRGDLAMPGRPVVVDPLARLVPGRELLFLADRGDAGFDVEI